MVELRPALAGDFDEVYPLLLDLANRSMSRDDWRRMLFDLPWPVEEAHRGYVLYEGAQPVGFLGTIFSTREVGGKQRRFCNLSSWIVKESHRSSSFQLLLPILGMKTHTIVNLSASPAAHEIFRGLGFQTLENLQVLVPAFARPGDLAPWSRCSVTTRLEQIRSELNGQGRMLLDHMRGTLAAQALLRCGRRSSHVIATRSPWKPRLPLAHVLYASDWDLVCEHVSLVSLAFFRTLGTAGLRIDGRRIRGKVPPFSVKRQLALPTLYRPSDSAITPDQVDNLYTEMVGQRW